jgi:hypothetical protein
MQIFAVTAAEIYPKFTSKGADNPNDFLVGVTETNTLGAD